MTHRVHIHASIALLIVHLLLLLLHHVPAAMLAHVAVESGFVTVEILVLIGMAVWRDDLSLLQWEVVVVGVVLAGRRVELLRLFLLLIA